MLKSSVILLSLMSISAFASAENAPPAIPEGKAQIVAYREKTMLGVIMPVHIYDVSDKYKSDGKQPADTESGLPAQTVKTTVSVIPYDDATKIARTIKESSFKIGESKVLNVDPGTYYFIVTNFDILKNDVLNRPLGTFGDTKNLGFPVIALTVESGKRYFMKSYMLNEIGSRLAVVNTTEGFDDLKWANDTRTDENISSSQSPPALPKKVHKHTGFYLSLNVGPGFGSDITTGFPSTDTLRTISIDGVRILESFSIGWAVKENLIIFADIPDVVVFSSPTIKVNNNAQNTSNLNQPTNNDFSFTNYFIGCGIIYYFMPYNLFASATLGPAFSLMTIDNSSPGVDGSSTKSLRSNGGFGMRIRAGKEWWVSNRWAIGAAGLFQFSTHGSGEIFRVPGQMNSLLGGISLTVTFN
jgi:hypothetical protein